MLKYCNGCKIDFEIDNFYSYKKSICKHCLNKKVKCGYCDREFNSTNLSKHIKLRHSTFSNSTFSNSTSNKIDKNIITDENNDPLYPTIGDGLYLNEYNKLKKDKINNLDIKTQAEINRILTKNSILHNKIINKTISNKEEKQFENNLNKLKDLDYFNERVCKILLKYKYFD